MNPSEDTASARVTGGAGEGAAPMGDPPRAGWATTVALAAVAVVWVMGAVWSFREQRAFAVANAFAVPELLPLVLDGMATALATVAYAASLDGRPAVSARLGTVVAVAMSAGSNGIWAAERSQDNPVTIGLAVVVPCTAMVAFEVLLAELRRQVQRRRGDPPPIRIPYPRMTRLLLAPFSTFVSWRRLVLELTELRPPVSDVAVVTVAAEPMSAAADGRRVRADTVSDEPTVATRAAMSAPSAHTATTGVLPVVSNGQVSGHRRPGTMTGHVVSAETEASPKPVARDEDVRKERRLTVASSVDDGADDVQRRAGDERVGRLVGLLHDGHELTGPEVAAMFSCSPRTGQRLIRRAEQIRRRYAGSVSE